MKELVYGRRRRKLLVPESWDEVSSRQYISIAGLLHREGLSKEAQLDRLLHILCGKRLVFYLMIPPETRMICFEHIAWVLTAKHPTKQMVPVYDGLYGPEANFGNTEVAEFHHTEDAYEKIVADNDLSALDELTAILYREPKKEYDVKRNPDGDVRMPFNFGSMDWNLKRVGKWPMDIKWATLLWYDACRENLHETHKPAFAKGKKSRNYYDGLYPMIRALAETGRYGPFKEVEKLNIEIAMMDIVSSKLEEDELKRKYPDLYK